MTDDNTRNDSTIHDLNGGDRPSPASDHSTNHSTDHSTAESNDWVGSPASPSKPTADPNPHKNGHPKESGPHSKPNANKAPNPELEPENFWVELRNIFVLSVALAIGLKIFVAESRFIPSESMLPTLEIDDRLIVEKMTYRFTAPQRGDVVVFRPTECAVNILPRVQGEALIKRIVGLPGETVEVRDGKVYIDGKHLVESYVDEAPSYTMEPKQIPEGSYLVLGDNRNNSYDGHVWGFLPRDRFIGRAAVRIWPLDRLGALDNDPPFTFDETDTVIVPEVPATEFDQCIEAAD